MRPSPRLITAVLAGALLISGAGACSKQETPATAAPVDAAASPTLAPAPSTVRLRVTDLMTKAGCKGAVIGTQLYSTETGRCTLSGTEVTIGVFDTAALRDEWVKAAKQFGGSYVTGEGWAARLDKADGVDTLAQLLGGKVA